MMVVLNLTCDTEKNGKFSITSVSVMRRYGATPRHCHYKEKEHGWPHPPTAERKTRRCTAMHLVPEDCRRKGDAEEEDLEEMGVSWHGACRIASDHERWRLLVARCSESLSKCQCNLSDMQNHVI